MTTKHSRLKRSSFMHRVSVVLLAGLVPVLGTAAPSSAAPVTVITHEEDFVDSFVGVINGCDEAGPVYAVTLTGIQVEKETLKDDGTFHGTSRQVAKVEAVPLDPSQPSYTGRWTLGGTFNGNPATLISVFTYSVTLFGSDGSKYAENEMIHYNARPDGTENFFGRCNNRT
jgi:hypothetical protein